MLLERRHRELTDHKNLQGNVTEKKRRDVANGADFSGKLNSFFRDLSVQGNVAPVDKFYVLLAWLEDRFDAPPEH